MPRTDSLLVIVQGARQNDPAYVGPARVHAGGRDMYEALSTEGRVAVQDILFPTDSDHNMQLSEERAASVRSWLVEKHGIAETRLRTVGLGQTQPVASNDTEEGRQQNRRVELVQIEDDAGGGE